MKTWHAQTNQFWHWEERAETAADAVEAAAANYRAEPDHEKDIASVSARCYR